MGPRRRAVDLVGKDEVREDRPEPGLELRSTGIEDRYAQYVGREEVARKLDAAEREAKCGPEGPRQRVLAYPGDVLEENMPAREECRDRQTYDFFLPVENSLDLIDQDLKQVERLRDVGAGYGISRGISQSH